MVGWYTGSEVNSGVRLAWQSSEWPVLEPGARSNRPSKMMTGAQEGHTNIWVSSHQLRKRVWIPSNNRIKKWYWPLVFQKLRKCIVSLNLLEIRPWRDLFCLQVSEIYPNYLLNGVSIGLVRSSGPRSGCNCATAGPLFLTRDSAASGELSDVSSGKKGS